VFAVCCCDYRVWTEYTCLLYVAVTIEPGQNIRCVLTYQSGNKASIPVSGAAMHIGIGTFLCCVVSISIFYRRSVAFHLVSVGLVAGACVRFVSIAGSSVQLDLLEFGHCNNVSKKHACLFYDRVSNNNNTLIVN
jgi:hypothetical protein